MWDDDEYYYYDTPDDYGGTVVEEEDDSWIDNGDGSWTDASTGEIYDDMGFFVGWDNFDGTWYGSDGLLYAVDNETIGNGVESSFEYNPDTDLYWDKLIGSWFTEDGQYVSDNPAGPSFEELADARGSYNGETLETKPGFFDTVGNFLGKIFGGSGSSGGGGFGGGGSFGGSSSSSGQKEAAQQREQQAAQQLAQARQQNASQQTITNLQRQLALAQGAAAAANRTDWTKPILIAGSLLVGAYAFASLRRNSAPPPP